RPLLFSSLSPETAAARGLPVRLIAALFLTCMAVAVAEAAQVVGVLLSTALLIGPPATAAYLSARPGPGIVLAAALGIAQAWLGDRRGLRQLQLAAGRESLAGELLHPQPGAPPLSAGPPAPTGLPAPRPARRASRGGMMMSGPIQPEMFSQPFMQNALLTSS